MKLEMVGIKSEGVVLSGLRYLPERVRRHTALLCAHGFTAGKYSLDSLASYLAGRGYEGLTFDFIGHKLGASGGEMRHMEQAVENLRDALAWLRQHSPARNVALIGHSMGAIVALSVVARERQATAPESQARLAGVVCMCAGMEPSRGFESAIGQAMLAQRSDYVAGAPALQLIKELDSLVTEARGVGNLSALFVAAGQDVLVSPERVEALAALVGPSASVKVVDTTHLEAPDRSRTTVIQWLEQQGF